MADDQIHTDASDSQPLPNGFGRVPIEITVSVGKARPRLGDLMRMGEDAVLTLDTGVDDPVELYVGDRLIARGTLEEIPGDRGPQLAVRLTEVADLGLGL